jgi:hypothetical protein
MTVGKGRHVALSAMGPLSENQGVACGDSGSVRKIDPAIEKQIPRCARDDKGVGGDLIRMTQYPSGDGVVGRLFQQAPEESEFLVTAPLAQAQLGRGSFGRGSLERGNP